LQVSVKSVTFAAKLGNQAKKAESLPSEGGLSVLDFFNIE
jgi:hypothetical protein